MASELHRIVIVGGGAGGLVLATRLGQRLGRKGRAAITLVDPDLTHLWKPLLHEVAAGTLNARDDTLIYLGQARDHGFRFAQGRMAGIDRAQHLLQLAPLVDEEGHEIVGARSIPYDTLVVAIGSISNDFGIEGVREHCVFLDNQDQAERLHRHILLLCLHAAQRREKERPPLAIAIVGAGATGVELAAELHKAMRQLTAYGVREIDPDRDIRFTIIEAAPRILPALPERLSRFANDTLERMGVRVLTGEQVSQATEEGIRTRGGHVIQATLTVWCAGIRGAEVLGRLDGLEVNRQCQLVVERTLQTSRDPDIFAMGDCAACPQQGTDRNVPARAQAAHQQAFTLARTLEARLAGGPPVPYTYKDYGSLISLSRGAVGTLMGNLFGQVTIEGWLARVAYVSLYRRHQMALHGFFWLVLSTMARVLQYGTQPRLKLH
jgi:NADH dehydrogenase